MPHSIKEKIFGSIVAIVTPFRDNKIDEDAFRKLIERQIAAGTHGIVPVGTTGESPTLDFDEHDHVIALAVEAVGGRVPVIAGTGANSTLEAIDITQRATKIGADVALIVAPYYNKPDQNALYAHYKAVHDATNIPILLYNVPGRTVSDLKPETVAKLSKLERIIGIKDATGELERFSAHRHLCGNDFILLSGEDGCALGAAAHGCQGCISVTANIAPELCAAFQNALHKGDFTAALALQDKLFPLHSALFSETSPAPVKYALSHIGICENNLRLPLIPVQPETEQKIISALQHAGIA
ncbi:MAG: 4-hydroxy-tetrahydrodipicolinate synthase [Pseudomonadota bacterium]